MNQTIEFFLKSKTVWVQILALIATLFVGWGDLGLINYQLSAAVAFALTLILNRWYSSSTIVETGVNWNWAMIGVNAVAVLTMLGDYFMDNQLYGFFGTKAQNIGMMVFTLNVVMRTFFANQKIAKPI